MSGDGGGSPPRARRFPASLKSLSAPPAGTGRHRPAGSAGPGRAAPAPGGSSPAVARGGALPAAAPAGVGLDSAMVRKRMVDRLRAQGCRDEAVLQAMGQVPRHLFVDTALAAQAYEDTSLPIGLGQTISKPSVVARMLELLRGRGSGAPFARVLEIGTGCGYQAALLSMLARQVYSVERLRPLHEKARETLQSMRPSHLRLIYADGSLGHPPNAPYDAIVSAAGAAAIPPAWVEQLAPGGRLVAPAHEGGGAAQVLVVIDRLDDGQIVRSIHEGVRFVPLESGVN
jgi:protein-L-isoaspartate(D-aspartate) O-methyltransferase